MAKESIQGIDKKCIFRETFNSETEVRRNGGTPTAVTFSNGTALNTGITGRINYVKSLKGTFSILISLKVGASSINNRYLFGYGLNTYIRIANGSPTVIEVSSGTRYINGIAGTAITSYLGISYFIQVAITGITLSLNNWDIHNTVANNYGNSDITMELFEIYSGTLSADEVKNLYENKRYKGLNVNHAEQLSDELITTLHNSPLYPFDTFNFNNSNLTCIDSGGAYTAVVTNNLGTVSVGDKFLLSWTNYTLNSGSTPSIYIQQSANGVGSGISAIITSPSTTYSGYIIITVANTNVYFEIGDKNTASNFSFTGLSLKKVLVNSTKEILNVSADNGIVMNKYSGGTLSERIVNGDFSSWTGGNPNGWSVTKTGTSVIQESSGRISMYRQTGQSCLISQDPLTVGKLYLVTVNLISAAGSIYMNSFGGVIDLGSAGLKTYMLTCSGVFQIFPAYEASCIIDDVSVKEVIPSVVNTAVSVVKENDVWAMKFNGSTSKIDCGNYDTLVGDKTFVAWYNIKTRSTSTGYRCIFSNGKSIVNILTTTMRIYFSSDGGSTIAYSDSGGNLPRNINSFVVVTRTSTGIINIYVNGSLSGTANQTSGTPAAGIVNMIIGHQASPLNPWDNTIPSVRIIDGLLTAQEIAQLYSAEKGRYGL